MKLIAVVCKKMEVTPVPSDPDKPLSDRMCTTTLATFPHVTTDIEIVERQNMNISFFDSVKLGQKLEITIIDPMKGGQ